MPPQYAKAIAVRNQFCPDVPLEPEFFTQDSPERTKEEIIKILERSKIGLHGMGWIGDSVERQWAKSIYASISTKEGLLSSSGFQKYTENWLIVYDDIPGFALDLSDGMNHLINRFAEEGRKLSDIIFRRVFLETHGTFVSILDDHWESVELHDLWRSHGG